MAKYAELEIGLHRRDENQYQVDLRFSDPNSDIDNRFGRGEPQYLHFEWEKLRALAFDDAAYGKLLGDALFGSPTVRTAFDTARAAAQASESALRLRLYIDASAPELHGLRWETLRDPIEDRCLLTDETLLFSRYLSSSSFDARRLLRPKSDLRALIAIANPTDIDTYDGMAKLNVGDELSRAKAGLEKTAVTELASGGTVTLNNLMAHLREGCDILYLVAHGKLDGSEPLLWLEQETGATQRVSGNELVNALRDVEQRPRLVVLVSCQSAGTGKQTATGAEGVLAALGPRLAEAGIPAVLAMQGNISIDTARQFMAAFFKELQRDGQIDRAMAVARGAVQGRPDWWMPVLFMRLKSGKIWYTPGFAEDPKGMRKWPAIITQIKSKQCLPILGPGVTEQIFGSPQELAQQWADEFNFPLSPYHREDLAQVAQFLAIDQAETFPQNALQPHMEKVVRQRYQKILPPELEQASLSDLLKFVYERCILPNPAHPLPILANLPVSIYITTDPSDLLEHALRAAGRPPHVDFCPWNKEIETVPLLDKTYYPSVKEPLVYHLFGILEQPESLVLTEDNYFDYLIGATLNKDLIPGFVRAELAKQAWLMFGFHLDDWSFRVLFRSITKIEGRATGGRRHANVAAQISPEEGRVLELMRALKFFENDFQKEAISIYWGSVEDFTLELAKQLK